MRLLFLLSVFISFTAFASPPSKEKLAYKVIHIHINDAGMITDGLDTLNIDELSVYIRDRLFKNYTGTGRMYDKIKIEKRGENVPATVIEAAIREIRSGQKTALGQLCLHKYKKSFEELTKKQQGKVKTVFPVLFQLEFL